MISSLSSGPPRITSTEALSRDKKRETIDVTRREETSEERPQFGALRGDYTCRCAKVDAYEIRGQLADTDFLRHARCASFVRPEGGNRLQYLTVSPPGIQMRERVLSMYSETEEPHERREISSQSDLYSVSAEGSSLAIQYIWQHESTIGAESSFWEDW